MSSQHSRQRLPIHARNHLQGGDDPLPGWTNAPAADPIVYSDYVLSLSNLIGYWRLGETGSPWADTSGASGGPRNMTVNGGSGPALTADVTGGLPVAQDDGAVQLNDNSSNSPSTTGGQYLRSPNEATWWNLNNVTATAIVKLHTSARSSRGTIVGNQQFSSGNRLGWALSAIYPSGHVRLSRSDVTTGERYVQSPAPLVADTWYHVAGSYDGANMKLYLNGVLVATTADATNVTVGTTNRLQIGYETGNFEHFWLYGTVDEVAVWNVALTADEIANLGSVIDPTAAGAGKTLISDGDGGTYWDWPLEVTY